MELNGIEWIYYMNRKMQRIYVYNILGVLYILLCTVNAAQSGEHDVSTIQTLTSTHFRSEENKDNNNGFITGYFSGFGSAAMVAALIVATFRIRRRYIAKKESSHTYYNEPIGPTADIGEQNGTQNYETLNETRQAEMTYSELQRRV